MHYSPWCNTRGRKIGPKAVTEGAMWEKSLRAKAIPVFEAKGRSGLAGVTGDDPWEAAPD